MTWLDRRLIPVGREQYVSPFWHCFGADDSQRVDEWTALQMLQASRTWLLPINCHALREYGPMIGHGPVTWERFRRYVLAATAVPCLNINLQTRTKAAIGLAQEAFRVTGIDLLKLEVLTDDLDESNDASVLRATRNLVGEGFRVMPLISAKCPDLDILAELDVPVIRVMGSPIGSELGIGNPDAVREIVSIGRPVILDGGIGSVRDIREAFELGCAGFLVNSCLFKDGDPVDALRDIRQELAEDDPPETDSALWTKWWDTSRA